MSLVYRIRNFYMFDTYRLITSFLSDGVNREAYDFDIHPETKTCVFHCLQGFYFLNVIDFANQGLIRLNFSMLPRHRAYIIL